MGGKRRICFGGSDKYAVIKTNVSATVLKFLLQCNLTGLG